MALYIIVLLLVFLIGTAVYSIFTDSVISEVISLSIFSINTAVIFVVLQDPDVAMTEEVIGAGLVTVFFVAAINKTEGL